MNFIAKTTKSQTTTTLSTTTSTGKISTILSTLASSTVTEKVTAGTTVAKDPDGPSSNTTVTPAAVLTTSQTLETTIEG